MHDKPPKSAKDCCSVLIFVLSGHVHPWIPGCTALTSLHFRLPVPVSLSPNNSTSLRLFSLSRATAPFSLARGAHVIHSDEGFKLEMSMVNLPYGSCG